LIQNINLVGFTQVFWSHTL